MYIFIKTTPKLSGFLGNKGTPIPISNAEYNTTFAIRYSPEASNKHIDIYTSNAYSFIDMGQLMRREKPRLQARHGLLSLTLLLVVQIT